MLRVTPSLASIFWYRSVFRLKLLPSGPLVMVKVLRAAVLKKMNTPADCQADGQNGTHGEDEAASEQVVEPRDQPSQDTIWRRHIGFPVD